MDAFVLYSFAAVALIRFDSGDEALICYDSRGTKLIDVGIEWGLGIRDWGLGIVIRNLIVNLETGG